MFGFSVFMNDELTEAKKTYIQKMAKNGFTGMFTSLHIPEDDHSSYKKRLRELGECAKKNQLELMVDISGDALNRAGFSLEDLEPLKKIGVTGLRMDYHIPIKQMAKWSHQMKISLNASTITEQDVMALKAENADFSKLEAWHNYYPRPETGLDRSWYKEKNVWLKKQGFTIQGFVAGDEDLRGPLYQGLPTLEMHRDVHPLAAALDLSSCGTDLIYIGDGGLSEKVQQQFFMYQKEQTILLHVKVIDPHFYEYVLGTHTNRQDEARDVIRSANARFREIPQVPPRDTKERKKGTVTLDNERYLRYMGEIQITKKDLPSDEKVNRVAQVTQKDLPLLEQIRAGVNFKIIEKEGKENGTN
ncbi:histidine kinase [Enterococcus villorum]|uniref:Histidine kinase n=1 Tax=Enterococcus villorum TaxID=112904 RepID=A0A1V8YEP2_9ENTE|nr:MupG family TIM beta-alpha barrel fold protein [Enterococcus villorum]OQO71081.1 histidine kinase [Enterococcus villorum]OQO73900.1 histidine kinase [Enterococcus villorum]